MASFTKPTSFISPVAPVNPIAPIMPIAPKSFSINGAMYPVESLPSLDTLNTLPNLNTMSSLGSLSSWKPRTNQQVSPFSDYNDPTQINSLADVIWNSIHQNNKLNTRDYGLLSVIGDSDIPLMSNISRALTGTFDLVQNAVIEPIKQNNYAALGINVLVNLETLDILANPVKGLVIDGPEGLVKGSVGRVNYDLDTGNLLLDMAGEILFDPFNWISFGSKAALSGGAKAILASSIDDVAQAAGGKFLKEGVEEVTQKSLKSKIITKAKKELFDKSGKFIAQNSDQIFDALFRAVNNINAEYFDDAFLKAIRDRQINKLIPQYLNDLRILRGIQGIANISDKAENILFKGAMYTNFIPIDQLKNIKQWGMFKNYTNKIITEVGQVVNGYINPAELTKLANYKTVTNPKNIEYQKMKVNQILKEGGIERLSYIDIDNAFSEQALEAARNVRFAIEEYAKTKDFDTFLRKVADSVVPKDIITDTPNLYKAVMKTLGEDLKLIHETTNKDGIKVFSNIAKVYEEMKNNIKNIYEYDKGLKNLKRIQSEISGKDIILTKHQQTLVEKYRGYNFNYITAYEKAKNSIFKLTEDAEALRLSKDVITSEDLQKLVDGFIKNITTFKHESRITKDVQEFYKDAIIRLKACKTVQEVYNLSKDLFDNTLFHIKQIQNVNSMYTIFKTKQALPIATIRAQSEIYDYKTNFIKDLIAETKFDIKKSNNLQDAINSYYKILRDKTIEIEDEHYKYFSDVIGAIDALQTKINSTPKDFKLIKKEFTEFNKHLQELAKKAQATSEYADYLINTSSAVKRYTNIENNLNKKAKAVENEAYGRALTRLRDNCTGGLTVFNEVIEQANKKTKMYKNNTGLVVSDDVDKAVIDKKATVFNTKNVGVKTTDTPEGATQVFYDLFKTTGSEEGVYNIGLARKLLDKMEHTNIISESKDMLDFRKNLIKTIEKFENNLNETPELFMVDTKARAELNNLIEEMQQYVFDTESEIITLFKKSTHTKDLTYDEMKRIIKNENFIYQIAQVDPNSIKEEIFYSTPKDGFVYKKGNNIKIDETWDVLEKNYIYEKANNINATAYLRELISVLDDTKDYMQTISSFDTSNKEFLAGAVGVMYASKDENLAMLYNALSEDIGIASEMQVFNDYNSTQYKQLINLINDPSIVLASKEIKVPKRSVLQKAFPNLDYDTAVEVYKELYDPTKDLPVIKQVAQKFLNDVKQYNAISNFVRRLTEDTDIPEGALRAVMSSLESFKNTQLGDLDIDLFTNKLYERINNFIYGVDSPKSLSVANLLTETNVKLKYDKTVKENTKRYFTKDEYKRFKQFCRKGETHIASDDAFVQECLIKLYMPDTYIKDFINTPKGRIYRNKDGGRLYIADCETSGKRGPINELAIKPFGSNTTMVFKVAYHDGWVLPQDEVLQKMFPKTEYKTAVSKYKELYNPDSAINKKAIEDGTTIFFNSEKELLENFKNYLDGFNMADEVIMHNGADFDYPVIRQRAFEKQVYLNTTKVKLSDSLVGMKENLPLINLDSAAQIKINNYIKQYLSELPDDDPTTYFLTAANHDVCKNITELITLLTKNTSEQTYNDSLIRALYDLKNKYYNLLSTNEKISIGAKYIFISKEFFQTKEGQDILLGEIKKAKSTVEEMLTKELSTVQRQEYELYLKSLNDTLELADNGILTSNNISRMMYINRFEGDPTIGFWKAVDLDTARNYMDIPDNVILSINELKAITNFTRPLKGTYDAIRNVNVLIENKDKISNTLSNILIKYAKDIPSAEGWLKYVRVNPEDFKTNYVLLQKMYNKYRRYLESVMSDSNEVYKVLEKVVGDEDVFKLLRDSAKEVFTKPATEDTLFGAFKSSLKNGEFYETSSAYREYVNKFNNIINTGLKGLGDSIDNTIFTSAFKFKTAQQTEVVSKAVDAFTSWMDTLPVTKQTEILKKVTDSTNYMDVNLTKQIFELSDKDLLNFILTDSMILQTDTELINSFDPNIINKFLERKKTLSDIGLEIDVDEGLGILTVYPTKKVGFRVEIDDSGNSIYSINGNVVEPIRLQPIAVDDFLDYMPDDVRQGFKKAQDAMNTLTNHRGAGVTYQSVDRSFYRKVYEKLPSKITNNMLDLEYFLKDGLFNKRTRFNTTIIGSQKFKSMYGDYIPNNFIKGYINSFTTLASRASDKANYIEMILNKDFSINNGFINELSFDEMRKMLEDAPEFNLACLVYNKSGKIELIDLKLNTEVDFQFAKKNNAVILPYHVFANAYQVINSEMYEEMNPVVRFLTKAMHMYKRGYLMSGGMIMRNTIDTFAKNLIISEGNPVQALSKTMDAMKLYMAYNETLNQIFKSSKLQRINKDSIKEFFDSGMSKKLSYEEFSFIHEVLNSGALIGEVKALDNYRAFSKAKKQGIDVSEITDLDDVTIKALSEDFDSVKHLTNGFMKVNNDIENIQRLSAYLLLQEQGLNFTEAIYRVSKDHFNYSMKSPREKLIELIIPFYTFKLNNLQYWAEALADNPWIAGLFEDIMTPIWDFDDVDENELQYNRSLQHRILSGNVQVADNGLTLKLNPSASDAFKLMTNPLGEIYNSTFALYTAATDAAMTQIAESTGNLAAQAINQTLNIYKPANPTVLDTVKSAINLLPYGAIAQRAISGVQYAKEINSILPAVMPSVFGRTKQYKQSNYNKAYTKYSKRNYTKQNYSKAYRKIAKPKKVYYRRNYTPNIYSDKVYPINFKNIYIDGMYSVPNISTYTAKANRYYHFSRLTHLPTVSIYDKLYNSRGKSRWDAMLQTVTPRNLKYVIKNTVHYK